MRPEVGLGSARMHRHPVRFCLTLVCLFVCVGCGQSEACMELVRRHQLRCRALLPYTRPGSRVGGAGHRGIRCAGSGIQQIVHPAPTGLNQTRPIVTWAITPAGASANVPQVVGKTPRGSPAPGSSHGSCAALTWQEELDMAGGPSEDTMDTKMGPGHASYNKGQGASM